MLSRYEESPKGARNDNGTNLKKKGTGTTFTRGKNDYSTAKGKAAPNATMQPVVSDQQFHELSEEDYKKLIAKQQQQQMAGKKRTWTERTAATKNGNGNGKGYVVFKGTRTGVFTKWEGEGGAQRATYMYKNHKCKSYPNLELAQEAWDDYNDQRSGLILSPF